MSDHRGRTCATKTPNYNASLADAQIQYWILLSQLGAHFTDGSPHKNEAPPAAPAGGARRSSTSADHAAHLPRRHRQRRQVEPADPADLVQSRPCPAQPRRVGLLPVGDLHLGALARVAVPEHV